MPKRECSLINLVVGDRVMAVDKIDGNYLKGKHGVVVNITGTSGLSVGVQFDEPIVGGHHCDHKGKDGYCWYCYPESLVVIEEDNSKDMTLEASEELINFIQSFERA